MKILLVDDSITSRKILKSFLEQLGHQIVAEGSDGHEAIELFFHYQPDIVFLDIIMPTMDGIQALEYIIEKDPTAKVIVCSSHGQKEYIRKAIMTGAREYIVKPILIERLDEVLKKVATKY